MSITKKFMLKVILFNSLVLFGAGAYGSGSTYWSNEIPIMSGASEVEARNIENLSTKSTSFLVTVDSIESVFEFYGDFFGANGWTDPYQIPVSMQDQVGGNWSGFNFSFGMDGNPKATFARTWKAADIPVMANVTFEATAYNGNQFSGTVTVTMSPEVSLAPLMSLQSELAKSPEALFILSEQVGGNPFDLVEADIAERPDMTDADSIVIEYFSVIDKILESYKLFREKHIKN